MTTWWGSAPRNEATLEIQSLLEGIAPGEGDMLGALHRVQHHFCYIPPESIPAVAAHLRLPPARVYGAVTFYSEYRQTPLPDTLVSWCSGPACYLKGGAGVREILEKLTGCHVGESTEDNKLGLHLGQ